MPSFKRALLLQIYSSFEEHDGQRAVELEDKIENEEAKAEATSFAGTMEPDSASELSMKYPQVGVLNDIAARKYIMSPGYWVYWKRADPMRMPTMAVTTSPPAVWWQHREQWRDLWPRLYTGNEGNTPFQFSPKVPPQPRSTGMGGAKWWEWLKDRIPDLKKGAEPKKPPKPKKLKGEYGPLREVDEPGEFYRWQDGGFFGKADVRSIQWTAQNSMRRQTLPGLSQTYQVGTDALRNATVRLDRFQEDNGMFLGQKATTLDPRPARPIDNVILPGQPGGPPVTHPFAGPEGLKNALGNDAMEAIAGASMLEKVALDRIQRLQPDWMEKYMAYKKAEHMYKKGQKQAADDLMDERKAHEAKLARQRKQKRKIPGMVQEPPEPEWEAPPKQKFADVYEDMWQKFWPSMEILARRHGKAAERSTMDIGAKWRALHEVKKPHAEESLANGIEERAGGDLRAVRALWGGPKDYMEEPYSSIDQQVPVHLPPLEPFQPLELAPPRYAKAPTLKQAPPPMPDVPVDAEHFIMGDPAGEDGHGVSAMLPVDRNKVFISGQSVGPLECLVASPMLAETWKEVHLLRATRAGRPASQRRRGGCGSICEGSRRFTMRPAFL
mmetsp:Transcript_141463/g.244470  ORF Transcript_141463/g.244470 Transcript_141463/m.244470 type:complete len:610 (+) Transcript_141463:59-1888(+)